MVISPLFWLTVIGCHYFGAPLFVSVISSTLDFWESPSLFNVVRFGSPRCSFMDEMNDHEVCNIILFSCKYDFKQLNG